MDLAAAERHDVIEGLPEQRGEFRLAAGNRRHAEFARRQLSGRRVHPKHGQIVPVDLGPQRRRRMVIDELQFDGAKTCRRGRAEPLDQRAFGKKIPKIGGKTRHGDSPARLNTMPHGPKPTQSGVSWTAVARGLVDLAEGWPKKAKTPLGEAGLAIQTVAGVVGGGEATVSDVFIAPVCFKSVSSRRNVVSPFVAESGSRFAIYGEIMRVCLCGLTMPAPGPFWDEVERIRSGRAHSPALFEQALGTPADVPLAGPSFCPHGLYPAYRASPTCGLCAYRQARHARERSAGRRNQLRAHEARRAPRSGAHASRRSTATMALVSLETITGSGPRFAGAFAPSVSELLAAGS